MKLTKMIAASVFLLMNVLSVQGYSGQLNICSFPGDLKSDAHNGNSTTLASLPDDRFWPWKSEDHLAFRSTDLAGAGLKTWYAANGVWSYHFDLREDSISLSPFGSKPPEVAYSSDSMTMCKSLMILGAQSKKVANQTDRLELRAKIFSPLDCSVLATAETFAEESEARLTFRSSPRSTNDRNTRSTPNNRDKSGEDSPAQFTMVLKSFGASTTDLSEHVLAASIFPSGAHQTGIYEPESLVVTNQNPSSPTGVENRLYYRYTRLTKRSELQMVSVPVRSNVRSGGPRGTRPWSTTKMLQKPGFACNNSSSVSVF